MDEAAALARRARAVEALRRLSAVAESNDKPAERLSTVAESDDTPAEQECDHFSMRGYVAMMQKKDPKLCSPHIFHNQPQHDEHHDSSSPVSVSKYHRWDCSKCLDRMKVSGHIPAPENVSMEQNGVNDGCSISIVRIRRLFSCTQQSSDQLTLSKTAQECNSKCSSPGNKAVTAMNVPVAEENVPEALTERNVPVAEENVPEALTERNVPATQDLQASPNNIDVSAVILNAASKNVIDLPDDVQKISVNEENGTQNPTSPKSCVAPNEDGSNIAQDVPNDDPNESNVPVSGHKGKEISGDTSNQVCNKGPRRASLRRNACSDGNKKRNKSTELPDISDLKISQRKPKKMRRLSELMGTSQQVGVSADAIPVDHANNVDPCQGGIEIGKDNDNPNQKVDEIESRSFNNKAKHTVDNVDDGSSLMNGLKSTHKKVRTEKDSEHKNLDSSAVPNSCPDIVASNDMHHDFLPSDGDVGQEKVPSTISANHGNGNPKNDGLGRNMQKVDDLCQNERMNLKQRFFSNEKSTILLKRKVLSTSVAHDENIGNSSMLRSDDLAQMEPEGSVQRCSAKVSLDNKKIQNVPGLREKNIPKNKKKRKQVHENQNVVIDDIPMDIVELLARNRHERQLLTDSNSLENCHTQPKVAQVDCTQFAAKDCPINASNEFNSNSQKSSRDHASSRTEAANVNLQDLHTQKSSQCLTASSASTEVPNGPPESMQNLLEVHALPIERSFNAYSSKLAVLDIVECTQEQQTQFHRDEVTIACTSPMFSHQHIAEVPARSWMDNGENELMWDSFKTASRNSPTSSYGFQFGNGLQEADSAPIHAYGASSNYSAHQPVIVAVDPYRKETVSLVQPRSVPSTALTMGSGRLYDQRIPGQSGLYPKEPIPATHLLRLMDSSTAPGFRNYQRADRRQMKLHQTQILGSKFVQHDQYNASPSTSYGSHIVEEVPLTLHDLSRRQLQQNLHRPVRPHPRVGVLGSLLQQDIANWSENYGPQSGYRLGVSQGTTSLDMNRKAGGWNTLQLGSATSVVNPEYQLPRYGTGQPSTSSNGKTVHLLDKLVRKDICVTNRNPADFTVISNKNEYMRSI